MTVYRPGDPTRLDRATDRERPILEAALDRPCPECGARPAAWCFRVAGVWTVHATRILGVSR